MDKDKFTQTPSHSSKDAFSLVPIFANSLFNITAQGTFTQVLTYDYIENSRQYFLKHQNDDEFYENEIYTIKENMQTYMDNCTNKVNGDLVFPEVIEAEIDFRDETLPFFYWIIQFQGNLIDGINIYESKFEAEELEYSISSLYILEKPLKVTYVESALNYEILQDKRMIKYWANQGEMVGPTEIIKFLLE